MIIKQSKNTKGLLWTLLGFFTLFALVLFSIDFNKFPQYKRDLTAKMMSQDLGFSRAEDLKVFAQRFRRKFPGILKGKVMGFENRPKIERIDFDIKFDDMQTILADRERGLENDILKDPTKVPARLQYKGKTYKAKVRIKGDLPDHWTEARRMSLRVSMSGKKSLFGYKAFSVHKPRVRQHPHDQAYQAIHQSIGGLSANHTYAHIYVNGVNWGVMNIEEHMTKELLEKSEAKESLIFRFSSEDGWFYTRTAGSKENKVPRYRIGDNTLNARIYNSSKYLDDDLYRKWYSYIIRNRLKPAAPEIYDVDKFARGIILSRLWNNTHTLAHSNSRYYLNPYTLKLEPITTDQGIANHIVEDKPFRGFDYTVYKMYQDVMTQNRYKTSFGKHYADISKTLMKSKPVFQKYHSYFPLDSDPNFQKIKNNIRAMNDRRQDLFRFPSTNAFADTELNRRLKIKTIDVSKEKARLLLSHIHALHYTDGRIEIFNLLPTDLDLVAIRVDGKDLPFDIPKRLPAYDEISYKPQLVIQTALKEIADDDIEIVTSLKGEQRDFTIPYTLIGEDLFNPLLQDNAAEFDFLEEIKPGHWKVKVGKWTVDRPIYVQGSLTFEAGTELSFASTAYMIIHGDMTATGTTKKKIIMRPQDKSLGWKGFYVVGGEKGSKLTHVTVEDTQALEDGLLRLTGGSTFYRTNVTLKYVKFLGTQAEDALNLVHSKFVMNKIKISHTRSDGFDGDFSDGSVENSLLEHIGGDALDYSGSKIKIRNPKIRFVKDKAISVGEASDVIIEGGDLHDIGVGIASKDGSTAQANNVSIRDFELSAAMTYLKKPFYGSPSLEIEESDIDPGGNYFRQENTVLIVDGKVIPAQKIDVETLYNSGVMKK